MSTRKSILFAGCIVLASVTAHVTAKGPQTELSGFTPAAVKEIERLLNALDQLKSYSDAGETSMSMGMPRVGKGQVESLSFQHPNQLRVEGRDLLTISDSRNLYVVRKPLRRYVTEPVGDSWRSQIERLAGESFRFMEVPSMAELFIAPDRRAYIAQNLQDADVRGREIVDGENCVILEGKNPTSWGDQGVTARWYLRDRDGLLQRVVHTVTPAEREEGLLGKIAKSFTAEMEQTSTFDAKSIRVNEDIPVGAFQFEPKRSWKKVKKFYDRGVPGSESSSQIALSGRPLPSFDLPLATGGTVTNDSFAERVGVIWFVPEFMFQTDQEDPTGVSEWLTSFEQVVGSFPAEQLAAIIVASDPESPLTKLLVERGLGGRSALDADGLFRQQFADEAWSFGFVFIGKDGTVQGLYQPGCGDGPGEQLKVDIEQLLKGENLPGSAAMSDDEVEEMRYQRRAGYRSEGGDLEPVNEERMIRAWSAKTAQDRFGGGWSSDTGEPKNDGLWLRSERSLKRIDPRSGAVLEEIRLARRSATEWFSEQILVAQGTKGRMVVTMAQEPIKVEEGSSTTRYPGPSKLTAANDAGETVWELELGGGEPGYSSPPAGLTAADVDGRVGDEIVFVHQGGLWIIDETGQPLVCMPLDGYQSWVRVEDLDGDRQAEIYIRYSDRLDRLDYAPK